MLDSTPKEIYDKKALMINPAKTCQPIGAMYAALGIHKCLPHSHGSQGCSSYHRMHLTRHFRDPIVASTSSFTEGASVFGGGANLKTAIKNIFSVYDPEIIAISTTCLSETIGDDISTIIESAEVPEGKTVFYANTPSYEGSHITGFSNMVKSIASNLVEKGDSEESKVINIIPGFVEPSDMREMKRIMNMMSVPFVMFPDTSGVVDTPMTGIYEMYPKGGTQLKDLKKAGNSKATIALGKFASEAGAIELDRKFKIPATTLKAPIGIKATDDFIMNLVKIMDVEVPYELEEERGQAVDYMTDTHYHYHGKKAAIFGDPDTVIAMTEFVLSLGMKPIHIVTGSPGKEFNKTIGTMVEGANVKNTGDLFTLHQWIKSEPVDLLIGNTYGKYIARAEDIPFVRIGFPVLDRTGHSYFPYVGYKGAIRLIEKISDALLDRADRDASDEDFELVM